MDERHGKRMAKRCKSGQPEQRGRCKTYCKQGDIQAIIQIKVGQVLAFGQLAAVQKALLAGKELHKQAKPFCPCHFAVATREAKTMSMAGAITVMGDSDATCMWPLLDTRGAGCSEPITSAALDSPAYLSANVSFTTVTLQLASIVKIRGLERRLP